MEKIKVASLFCGCGGMDLGVLGGFSYLGKEYARTPFEIVYSVDNDPYCTQIYNDNFDHKCMVKDVREIDIAKMPEFDMLIGGFPCQSFSISAQNPPRLGYKDERGMLFFEMVKILKERHPRFFIAENVKGLLSANNGKAFPMILTEFKNAGYHVTYKLLNAWEHGVPQKRERVIIVGCREDEDFSRFHFPSELLFNERKVLKDVIIEEEDKNEDLFFSEKAVAGMLAVKEKMNKGRVMKLNEPCNTISAHLAKVSLNSTDPVLMVSGRYRRFSTREAARIQSFPDSFVLDSVSANRQYKAIGNAVPPVLMWYVSNSLSTVITGGKTNPSKTTVQRVKQLNFKNVLEQNPEHIIDNTNIPPALTRPKPQELRDNNLLVSLVKNDTIDLLLDGSINIYYTGKKFPSTVALNHLYYFMPYRKGKGIRDLYYIKMARVGSKQEVHPSADPNDLRLVFEIEFVKQLFPDYKPIELKIWHAFTDTTLHNIMSLYEDIDALLL